MTRKRVYNTIVFVFIGCVLGVVVKYWSFLTFNFEVNVFDVLTLIITVFLAWWVTTKLEKDSTAERFEKDILIEKLKVMEGVMENIKQKATETEIVPLSDVIALINKFDVLSHRVLDSIENRYKSLVKVEVDYRKDLDELDDLCSNDKSETFPDNSIVMEEKDGISTCIYSKDRVDAIDQKSSDIINKLFNLQLLLNKA